MTDLEKAMIRANEIFDAMSDEDKAAHRAEQAKSFARGMSGRCEHGHLDFEQCPECRANARRKLNNVQVDKGVHLD